MMNGRLCPRKVQGCVPHDIGDPGIYIYIYICLVTNTEILRTFCYI